MFALIAAVIIDGASPAPSASPAAQLVVPDGTYTYSFKQGPTALGTATIAVQRTNGVVKTHEIAVQLREFPNKGERASLNKSEAPDGALEGVTVENVTPEMAHELKLSPATKGVVVDEVSPASRAAEAGLKPSDVIQEANHRSVKNVSDFRSAVNAKSKDDPILLLVNREGSTIFLTV